MPQLPVHRRFPRSKAQQMNAHTIKLVDRLAGRQIRCPEPFLPPSPSIARSSVKSDLTCGLQSQVCQCRWNPFQRHRVRHRGRWHAPPVAENGPGASVLHSPELWPMHSPVRRQARTNRKSVSTSSHVEHPRSQKVPSSPQRKAHAAWAIQSGLSGEIIYLALARDVNVLMKSIWGLGLRVWMR